MNEQPGIILDLDETLISAVVKDGHKLVPGLEYSDMENVYIVYHRPHLQEFLDFIFQIDPNTNEQKNRVSVWTAASRDYGDWIIDNIILIPERPERKLDFFLHSYHSELSSKFFPIHKDLRLIWKLFKPIGYTPENTLLIDDYQGLATGQSKNVYQIQEFLTNTDQNPTKDSELLKLKEWMEGRF